MAASSEPTPEQAARLTAARIRDLWERTARRFLASRNRILFCSRFRRGGEGVELPEDWETPEVRGALTVELPQRKLEELRLRAIMAKLRPTIRREPVGPSLRAQLDADNLEAWANAAAEQLIDWETMVGKGLSDGEYAVVVLASPVDWEQAPTFLTSLDEDALDELVGGPAVEIADPTDPNGPATRRLRPDPRYFLDSAGRRPGEPGYRPVDARAAARNHQEELLDFLRRRLPFTVRVISALDCVPILGRGRGAERWSTLGLIIRTLYEPEELLQAGFLWEGMHRRLLPRGFDAERLYGNDGQLYLYELYATDHRGHPFVAYSVGLEATWIRPPILGLDGLQDDGRPVEAFIDLFETFGLTRLPARYCWGAHTDEDDPDAYGIPFLDPLAPILINTEGLLTATLAHAWKTAFPGYAAAPNPEAPPQAYLEEDQKSLKKIRPPSGGDVVVLPGPLAPVAPPPLGESAKYIVAQMLATWAQETPADAALGGPTPNARTSVVSRDFVLDSQWMVLDGARRAYEWAVEMIIEWAECLRKRYGVRVPVYANFRIASDAEDRRRMVKELDERWVGVVYDVTAELPKIPNLAEAQQRADMVQRGLATPAEVRELLGDESPLTTIAEIEAWRYYREDPMGRLEIQQLTAELQGDQERAERLRLAREGKLTEGGFPTAAIPDEALAAVAGAQLGAAGPPTGGPPPTGLGVPNLAASALGGRVAADMQAAPLAQEARVRAQIEGA